MKKKIFTMGKVYDIATLGVNEVENEVQADLDKIFNAGGVKFLLREVPGKTLELTFLRKYREGKIDWLNYDSKQIYNIDANIITGHSFNGFSTEITASPTAVLKSPYPFPSNSLTTSCGVTFIHAL